MKMASKLLACSHSSIL